jgi:hypothetical protein
MDEKREEKRREKGRERTCAERLRVARLVPSTYVPSQPNIEGRWKKSGDRRWKSGGWRMERREEESIKNTLHEPCICCCGCLTRTYPLLQPKCRQQR